MSFRNQAITLHSDALPDDTLLVTKVSGHEQLSGLFRFELELLCQDKALDLEAVLYAPARLGVQVGMELSGGGQASTMRHIAGVFAEFEQQEEGQGWVKYTAVLVPKLWLATRSARSRIFMDLTVDEVVEAVLEADGLRPKVDFECVLNRAGGAGKSPDRAIYPQREYVVQYEESDWDFLARWLEHEGIWFHFQNSDDDPSVDKVVFGDNAASYAASSFAAKFPFRPQSASKDGASDRFAAEEVYTFRCRQTRLPSKVSLNDYNWRTPSAELLSDVDVKDGGTGVQKEYNDHFKTAEQGEALAKVRGEEWACRARWFHGESSCRTMRPGYLFELGQHYRDEWNQKYVITAVQHEAEQMISLDSSTVTGVKYANTFAAIPADQEFRPVRATAWPSIKGVMHARVDGEGDGQYAELDEFGRYKLVVPFDEHAPNAKPGRASRWVRMAQPYAGRGAGMHFPLLKGAEVLITHIDGDPDRPVISGAVPNPEHESPTTGDNRSRNTLRTHSGNVLMIDDDASVSGFYEADASGSRVSDRRWRRAPGSGVKAPEIQPAGGGGGVEGLAAGAVGDQPAGGEGMPEIVSTIWETGVTGTGIESAWKDFFGLNGAANDAFTDIATKGRYTDETTAGLSLSAAAAFGVPLLTDTTLKEKNLVTVFNHLLSHHARKAALTAAGAAVPGTQLSGAVAGLVKKARNLDGMITGSMVEVLLGDKVTVTVGDSYQYADVSNDIKIGTGGSTIEENRGDTTKSSKNWGNATENSENYGDKTETSLNQGNSTKTETIIGNTTETTTQTGNKSETTTITGTETSKEFHLGNTLVGFNFFWGAKSETEIFAGAQNTNSISLLAVSENSVTIAAQANIDIFVGGKFELEMNLAASLKIEISAAVSLEVTLGKKLEFQTENFSAILTKNEATLQELEANLKKTDADILRDQVGIKKTEAAIDDMKATINANNAALSKSVACLRGATVALKNDDASMMSSALALSRQMTSAVTMIQ